MDSNITLAKYSIQALDRIFIEGFEYKKAGVIVGNISPKPYKQMNLFENENPKHKALMQTITPQRFTFQPDCKIRRARFWTA